MDWLAWLLSSVVIFYLTVYTYKTFVPLYRYKKAKECIKYDGKIVEKIGEEKKKIQNECGLWCIWCSDANCNVLLYDI